MNVTGLYVTPGLVDIHVHVYNGADVLAEYSGDRSVAPDGFTFRSGVTTVVDLGSSGWRSFADFKTRVIDRARTRVLAMLNIVGRGMAGGSTIEQNTQDMQPEETARVARQGVPWPVGVYHRRSQPRWSPIPTARRLYGWDCAPPALSPAGGAAARSGRALGTSRPSAHRACWSICASCSPPSS